MTTVTRKYVWLLSAVVVVASALVGLAVFRQSLVIGYHQWRMNVEFNRLFGAPGQVSDGLASYDVTGVDVEAVMERYFHHRDALVDLGILTKVSAKFPQLIFDGAEQQTEVRSQFVNRMWNEFPGHKHYNLADDGSFETWVPAAESSAWKSFIDDESKRSHLTTP